MHTYLPPVSESRLRELAAEWAERAERLDDEAVMLHAEALHDEAEECELAANDYREAIEGLCR